MRGPAYPIGTDSMDVEKQGNISSCQELKPPDAAILTYCCNHYGSRHSYQNKTKRLRDNKVVILFQRRGLLKIVRDLCKLARESREIQCEIDKLQEDVKRFENTENRTRKTRNVGLAF